MSERIFEKIGELGEAAGGRGGGVAGKPRRGKKHVMVALLYLFKKNAAVGALLGQDFTRAVGSGSVVSFHHVQGSS